MKIPMYTAWVGLGLCAKTYVSKSPIHCWTDGTEFIGIITLQILVFSPGYTAKQYFLIS